MNHRRSSARQLAEELLADGEWQSYEKLMARLVRLIPPGQAARRAEEQRKHSSGRGRTPPPTRVKHRPLDQVIQAGARSIVQDLLRDPKRFEVEPRGRLADPTVRRIRMLLDEPPPIPEKQPPMSAAGLLTPQQVAILQLHADGFSTWEISVKLDLPYHSIRSSRVRSNQGLIMSRLGVHTMYEAVVTARDQGILAPPGPIVGLELRMARVLRQILAEDITSIASMMDVSIEVATRVKRRLFGRFGVGSVAALRERVRQLELLE